MIPSPLQRTDATAQGLPAATVQKQVAVNASRAPETNRAHRLGADAPKAIFSVAAERIDFDISISIETMQLEMSGSANVTAASDSFSLDISFAYFNVVIVSGPYQDPLFSGSGDVSMPMTRGEFALLVSPGSRSDGQGYLAAVRKLAVQLASIATGSHRAAPAREESVRSAEHQEQRVEVAAPTPSGDATMAASSVAAAAVQAASAAPARTAAPRPNPYARSSTPRDLVSAIAQAASRMSTRGDVNSRNATLLTTTVASFSSLLNSAPETAASGDAAMSLTRDRLRLRINEEDLTAQVNVERISLDEETASAAGRWVDETA